MSQANSYHDKLNAIFKEEDNKLDFEKVIDQKN